MHSARMGLCISAMMALCGYVSSFILAESQALRSSVTGQQNKEIEKKIYFLTKLLQQMNLPKDTSQSFKEVAAITGTRTSAMNVQSLPTSDNLYKAIKSDIGVVNPPVNAEIYVQTTVDDDANTNNSKLQEKGATLSEEEQRHKDLTSLSNEDKSYIKNEFKTIVDMVRLLDEKTKQNSIKVDKKDFAILPPASEWCRLMGFRRCRGNQS